MNQFKTFSKWKINSKIQTLVYHKVFNRKNIKKTVNKFQINYLNITEDMMNISNKLIIYF